MSRNGKRGQRRPQMKIEAPGASVEEAAAIAAALEQFIADTAPSRSTAAQPVSRWQRTALVEGVRRAEFDRP
jgi:hypothetical protein